MFCRLILLMTLAIRMMVNECNKTLLFSDIMMTVRHDQTGP